MFFELNDVLKNAIVNALENQEKKFFVDAQNANLVEDDGSFISGEERFYELPEWDSASGFSLMEEFVSDLHSPLARNDLQAALRSGKGVFRGFKDVLKSYPLVERRWHFFKNRRLLIYVQEWYNSLREMWGLEKLDCQAEELSDLVGEDFIFREYNSEQDRISILQCVDSAAKEFEEAWPAEFVAAVRFFWREQFEKNAKAGGFVCRSLDDEFVGCAVFSPCPENSTKAVFLAGLFVEKEYRGLGIARELFEMALSSLKENGVRWIFVANTFVPDSIQGMLSRSGFKEIGSAYAADLFAEF